MSDEGSLAGGVDGGGAGPAIPTVVVPVRVVAAEHRRVQRNGSLPRAREEMSDEGSPTGRVDDGGAGPAIPAVEVPVRVVAAGHRRVQGARRHAFVAVGDRAADAVARAVQASVRVREGQRRQRGGAVRPVDGDVSQREVAAGASTPRVAWITIDRVVEGQVVSPNQAPTDADLDLVHTVAFEERHGRGPAGIGPVGARRPDEAHLTDSTDRRRP